MAGLPAFSILVSVMVVSACATPAGTVSVVAFGNLTRNNANAFPTTVATISTPRHRPSSGRSSLSSIPPATMRVLPLDDDRKDLDVEGRVSAAFGVPMRRIRFEPSPATLLGQAVTSEFKAAGHDVMAGAASARVTGAVLEFDAHTVTTLLYWDVIGNLAVSLHVTPERGSNRAGPLVYRAQCQERTYVWPGEAFIAGVMARCVDDFATQLRSDGRVADALRVLASDEPTERGTVDGVRSDGAARPLAETEKSYTNPVKQWAVNYPGDWTLDGDDRIVKISRGQAVLGIHSLSNGTGASLDEVADSTIKEWEQRMQSVNTVKRISRKHVTMAGDLSAIAIEHHIGTGQVGKSRKLVLVVKDRGYLIDAETYLASWPDVERDFDSIVRSFRILN